MEKKQLSAYQANKRRIERIKRQIEDEELREIPIVTGKVQSSMPEHPYIPTRVSVQMDEPVEKDFSIRRIKRLKEEKSKLESACLEVEQFIGELGDETDREIFECRFIDGMTQNKVAERVGYTQSTISKKITAIIQNSYNS